MKTHVNVDQWVGLFRQIKLTEEQMHTWHRLFEEQYPDAHQSFLEWLGLDSARIASIRERSKR